MKKIYIYITLFVLLFSGMVGCGDNIDVSGEYVLTTEELDELARQKRLADSLRNVINADLILEYTTEIIILNSGYDGSFVYLDTVKIAEFFEITPTQLAQGIQNMRTETPHSGAPDITGFCIEWTTRSDNMTAYNTNACWGHWWDMNGNTTVWGDNAKVFAEYNPQEGCFHVGQMTGGLLREVLEKDKEEERNIKFIECLKYNDKRIAIVITVIPKERGAVEGGVVNTQQLSIDVSPKSVYDVDLLEFDLARTLSDLGISSIDEASTLAVNEDGSYAQETNAGNNGFWYDMNGFAGQWGDNASVYTSLETDDDGNYYIGIGQYPGHIAAGETYTVQYGFIANDKIEMLKITVNVLSYQDPETPPAGDPQDIEQNITLTKPYDTDFLRASTDVKELLRNAFKMTTYQLFSALNSGSLKVYMQEATAEDPSYTGGGAGEYWIDADGNPCAYADGMLYIGLYASETELTIGGGNHPANADPAGQVINTKMIITCNGAKAVFNITYNLTAAEGGEE